MSTYMDYKQAATLYDEARRPAGATSIWQIMTSLLKMDTDKVHVLEAGCGTGNYSLEFLQHGLKHLTMTDASEHMLEKARQKTLAFEECVKVKQMVLPNLEFPDKQFDAVLFIQVFHHIDSVNHDKELLIKEDYPNMIRSIKEAYRIMKPGGVLVIDAMFEENIDSFWWTSLCPKAARLMKNLRMKKEDLLELISECGFKDLMYVVRPASCLMKRDIYDDILKINDPHWRSYLSQFKLPEKTGELEKLIEIVNNKQKEGCLDSFFYDLNKTFRMYGNHSTVYAVKP